MCVKGTLTQGLFWKADCDKRTVVVSLGRITNVSVQLEVGKAEQTIEVTAESPLLHTENANLATTVDQVD